MFGLTDPPIDDMAPNLVLTRLMRRYPYPRHLTQIQSAASVHRSRSSHCCLYSTRQVYPDTVVVIFCLNLRLLYVAVPAALLSIDRPCMVYLCEGVLSLFLHLVIKVVPLVMMDLALWGLLSKQVWSLYLPWEGLALEIVGSLCLVVVVHFQLFPYWSKIK